MTVKRQRWLVIADSLALPRPGVSYEATWPYLLQREFANWDWVNLARRSSTTSRLVTDGDAGADCLEFYAPDGVILHLGICDCAPRLYRQGSIFQHLVYRLPGNLGRGVSDLIESYRGRRASNALVGTNRFRANLENYLRRCKDSDVKVIALEIMLVGEEMIGKNPGIVEQIEKYNRIYRDLEASSGHMKVVNVFDMETNIELFTSDGYHLNVMGNSYVASAIEKALLEV
jgi:acyl-CoA thioesterase I